MFTCEAIEIGNDKVNSFALNHRPSKQIRHHPNIKTLPHLLSKIISERPVTRLRRVSILQSLTAHHIFTSSSVHSGRVLFQELLPYYDIPTPNPQVLRTAVKNTTVTDIIF